MSRQTTLCLWMVLGSMSFVTGRNFSLVQPSEFDCSWRSNGFYPSPTSCYQYYMCIESQGYRSECADDLIFDPATNYCVSASEVDCDTVTTQTVTFATTSTSGHNPDQGSGEVTCADHANGDYFKDPADCSFFYICDNGHLVHTQCPATLVFNPQSWTCDYTFNVPGCY